MSDLSRLIGDLCAGLDEPSVLSLSGFPETLSSAEILQQIDPALVSWPFRSFQPGNGPSTPDQTFRTETPDYTPERSHATSSYAESPERPETPERGVKTLAETAHSPFPVRREEPERPERERTACGHPALDLNRAAPQRSDWWTGPAVAEVDRLVPRSHPVQPSPTAHLSGPQAWRDGLALLDRWAPPCPGFRAGEWDSLHRTIAHFMDHAAVEAAARGWTAIDLFGVHRDAGAAAVDSCGALMLPCMRAVTAVSDEALTFGPLVYRRRAMPQAVLAWEFAGGGWREDQ